jgi:hypothetical protein
VNNQFAPHYTIHDGILRYKGRICIGDNTDLKNKILTSLHSKTIGGHSAIRAAYQRIKKIFHWPNLKKFVENFVNECVVQNQSIATTQHGMDIYIHGLHI